MVPQVGLDLVHVLRRIGYDLDFPAEQTCCGQPAFNTGYWVVCPSGSCTSMVREFFPELLAGTSLADDAVKLGERVFEFSEFLVKVAKVTDVGASFPHRVAVHDSCHGLRELHLKQEPRELLRRVKGLELVEMPYSEDCCGFGGTFSVKFGMIAAGMGDTKAGYAESSGAEYVTATDPSCLMHLEGILRRRNSKVKTIHLTGILAQSAGVGARTGAPHPAEAAR